MRGLWGEVPAPAKAHTCVGEIAELTVLKSDIGGIGLQQEAGPRSEYPATVRKQRIADTDVMNSL